MKIYHYIKRTIDLVLSLLGLFILGPVFLALAILIKLDSNGPVFFKQQRVGKGKKIFSILKFRTMVVDTPNNIPTHMLESPHVFITRIGRFLRKTSLDELPQLVNIIRGDMSIVGPRPALWNQYDLISERDLYGANQIRPGLTGWAQISGRDELPVIVKAKFDGVYVEKMSFSMDVKCVLLTIVKVVRADGVVEGGPSVVGQKIPLYGDEVTKK